MRIRFQSFIPFLVCSVLGLFLAILLIACASAQATTEQEAAPATGPEDALLVAAAADLQFAFTEIGERFEEQTGNRVTFTFGSTGNLTSQIENGAPFDILAAANVSFIEQLRAKELIIPDTQQL